MGFDKDKFYEDLRRRSKEMQDQLKKLSDKELMRVHIEIFDKPEHERDTVLMLAASNEVQRRSISAGWFWKRWFKREQYEQWVRHNATIETKARQELVNILQKYDDPTSQEVVRRLGGHNR